LSLTNTIIRTRDSRRTASVCSLDTCLNVEEGRENKRTQALTIFSVIAADVSFARRASGAFVSIVLVEKSLRNNRAVVYARKEGHSKDIM
jgi:hypothetical protein